jgi:hypothetical protein
MIRKSGNRFSEKIMRKQNIGERLVIQLNPMKVQ